MNIKLAIPLFLVAFFYVPSHGEESATAKVTSTGFVYYQIGQMVKTWDQGASGGTNDKAWDQHVNFRLGLDAVVEKHLHIIGGAEYGMATLAKLGGGGNSFSSALSLKEAQGIYSFGDDPKNSLLQIALGYFPFKYNPQATNMGEYLFSYRTGAYPPYIINDFDNPKARLTGLRISSSLFERLKLDLLFTTETQIGPSNGNQPFGDISVSGLVGYKIEKLFDIGVGACLYRLFAINPSATTPRDNIIFDNTKPVGLPIIENGDTLHYTLKALKLMARCTFDPKQLLPVSLMENLGKEDCKLYGETAILGVKNYGDSAHYDDIYKRWPIMIGFNIPAFKVLDLLSLELEYFGNPVTNQIPQGSPIPNGIIDEFSTQNMFHWSIFAQKTLCKGFTIKGVIGKDHFRTVDAGGSVTAYEELRASDDWHYNLRFMYSF